LKEKVGYPWTTLPDFMFEHAGQGYAGHGTLCGALGVSSYLINLAVYDEKGSYRTVIDRMMWWYAGMKFPTDSFDDISAFHKQVQAQAIHQHCHMASVLCHQMHLVRDHDDRYALRVELSQGCHDLRGATPVLAKGWLVQHQDALTHRQHGGQAQAPLLSLTQAKRVRLDVGR